MLPGDSTSLHFGVCSRGKSGFHYCDWELHAHSSKAALGLASDLAPGAPDAALMTAISTVVIVAGIPSPLEGLHRQGNEACRWHAFKIAEETIQLLLQEVHRYTFAPKNVPARTTPRSIRPKCFSCNVVAVASTAATTHKFAFSAFAGVAVFLDQQKTFLAITTAAVAVDAKN